LRKNVWALFAVSMSVNVGMWLERFVIIVISLTRDFLPSSWGMYHPTRYDWGMFLGTIGFFTFAFTLFIRFLPSIAMFEMRGLVPRGPARPGKDAH
jgi:molybdopterin-containing oxidoreductase family membrane subunit